MKIQKIKTFPAAMTEERQVLEILSDEIMTEFFEHEKETRYLHALKFVLDNVHALKLNGRYPDKTTIQFTGTQWLIRMEVVVRKQEVNT